MGAQKTFSEATNDPGRRRIASWCPSWCQRWCQDGNGAWDDAPFRVPGGIAAGLHAAGSKPVSRSKSSYPAMKPVERLVVVDLGDLATAHLDRLAEAQVE